MPRLLCVASLLTLLSVVALRPLVAETYDSASNSLTRALGEVGDPSPTRTLVFDLLILLSLCGWLAARAMAPQLAYRKTGLEWGTAIIAIAAAISCFAAGNQRLAINASIDWLCGPLLAITLAQLTVDRTRQRLVWCVVLASACAQAFACFDQYFIGHEDTWRHYQQIKQELWAQQSVELDSEKVRLFENRIRAREASGFLPHSNVTASYFLLTLFAGLGLVIGARGARASDHPPRSSGLPQGPPVGRTIAAVALGGLMVAAIGVAILLTKSRGALVAGGIGGVIWVCLAAIRRRATVDPRRVFQLGWGAALVAMAAALGHGLYHGRLPGVSLMFRWQYWTASVPIFLEHLWTGVGRENYGRHYLQHKLIECPEEVATPHNLFVQAACDWGVAGLVGLLVLLVLGSRAVCLDRGEVAPPQTESSADERTSRMYLWLGAIAAVVCLVRMPLLDSGNSSFVYYSTVTTMMPWLVGALGFAWIASLAPPRSPSLAGAAEGGLRIGLLAFLIHDLINFAAFVPGTATTFFALLGASTGTKQTSDPAMQDAPKRGRRMRWVLLVIGLFVTGSVAAGVVVPVAWANSHLGLIDAARREKLPLGVFSQLVRFHCQRAAKIDPLDPTPHSDLAEWSLGMAALPEMKDEALAEAEAAISEAIRRDSHHLKLRQQRVDIRRTKALDTRSALDLRRAVDAAGQALALYPADPDGYVLLGDTLREEGAVSGDRMVLQRAADAYQRALDLDSSRLSWETIRRFSEGKRRVIEDRMREVRTRTEE